MCVSIFISGIFLTNFSKFKEACDLVELKAAFSLTNYSDLMRISTPLLTDEILLKTTSEKARNYIISSKGATDIIVSETIPKN